MTDNQIIIEVAKLDDFIQIGERPVGKHEFRWMGLNKRAQSPEEWWDLPLYLTSLDAIIPVIEKTLKSSNDWFQFFLNLGRVCRDIVPDQSAVITNYKLVLLATPKQLSIALLKAVGKWTEE